MDTASLAEAMEREHAELGRQLRNVFEATKASNLWGARLAPCLESIRGHLLEHFRFEEQDGYMEAVVQSQPHQKKIVERLLEEHRALDATLQELIATARTTAELGAPFAEKIKEWLDRMHRHEAEENRLVLTNVNQDEGTKD